jgi:hypothetical protein
VTAVVASYGAEGHESDSKGDKLFHRFILLKKVLTSIEEVVSKKSLME